MPSDKRRFVILVADSAGCGALPDAAAYGDEGSNTLGNIAKRVPLAVGEKLFEIIEAVNDDKQPEEAEENDRQRLQIQAGQVAVENGHGQQSALVAGEPTIEAAADYGQDVWVAGFERSSNPADRLIASQKPGHPNRRPSLTLRVSI